jgi:hypothetical protein
MMKMSPQPSCCKLHCNFSSPLSLCVCVCVCVRITRHANLRTGSKFSFPLLTLLKSETFLHPHLACRSTSISHPLSPPLFFILPRSELRSKHPEWCRDAEEQLIGWTYDGRAALYCSVPLDFLSTKPVCAIPSRGNSRHDVTITASPFIVCVTPLSQCYSYVLRW